MILGRLDLLTSEEQRTLTYASVEGDEFSSAVLAALLGVDEIELEERLDGLEKVHRLIERLAEERWPSRAIVTRYRFGHSLYRDFLYQRILPKRRRQLHGQVALTLVKHFGAQSRRDSWRARSSLATCSTCIVNAAGSVFRSKSTPRRLRTSTRGCG
jgi:predicted ATPase